MSWYSKRIHSDNMNHLCVIWEWLIWANDWPSKSWPYVFVVNTISWWTKAIIWMSRYLSLNEQYESWTVGSMWPSAAGKVNCQRLSGFSSFDQWNRHFLLEMPLESPMYYSQKIILEKISISHQNYQILAWVFFLLVMQYIKIDNGSWNTYILKWI